MVSVLASRAVDRWLDPRSGQTKDTNNCIYCFSARHAAINYKRRKNKDSLSRNRANVSECGDMSIRGLFCFSVN